MAYTFSLDAAIATTTGTPSATVNIPTNGILVLGIVTGSATNRSGGAPTFNGVAMTQAGTTQKAASSPETSCELWYSLNQGDATNHTLSIPNAGALDVASHWSTYTYTAGKTPALDVTGGNNGTSANPSVSVVTTVTGDVVVAVMGNGLATAPTAQSGNNLDRKDEGAWSSNYQYTIAGAPGSVASSWTVASDDWGLCVAAFKEVSAASSKLALLGVG